jgi:hypothetical protein
MGPGLRWHHYAPNFLYLRVIRWRRAIQVPGNLRAEIRNADEFFEDVFREYVSVPGLLDVLRINVDVVDAKVEICGGDGAHAPVGL